MAMVAVITLWALTAVPVIPGSHLQSTAQSHVKVQSYTLNDKIHLTK